MYLIRRVAKCHPGKAWEVAGYLKKITRAYEEGGRLPAQIYIGGQGLPGTANVVYAEWLQEKIEPIVRELMPPAVMENHNKMMQILDEYTIEFYELATPEKLQSRGFI